jgi:transglutaminase-like putative cysteine protease
LPTGESGASAGNPSQALTPAITIETQPLADGTDGTLQALDRMAETVRGGMAPDFSGYRDAQVRGRAAEITGRQFSPDQIISRLFTYTRDAIRYIDHPWNLQVVQDCLRTLLLASGDCVSKSVCLSTLLASLGLASRFVAQCPVISEGFDHVYCEAFVAGYWVALDPTGDGRQGRPLASVGWSRPLPDGGAELMQPIF